MVGEQVGMSGWEDSVCMGLVKDKGVTHVSTGREDEGINGLKEYYSRRAIEFCAYRRRAWHNRGL